MKHGTVAGYVRGCRDECCREASRIYDRQRRARRYIARGPLRIDALGTRRRIHALAAIGWPLTELDAHLNRKRSYCFALTKTQAVNRATALEVHDMFERLSMTPYGGRLASRQRSIAARRGWLPPLAWVDIDDPDEHPDFTVRDDQPDPVVIDRLMAGDYSLAPSATRAEKVAVVARWKADRRSLAELERQTGWNVNRYREEVAA